MVKLQPPVRSELFSAVKLSCSIIRDGGEKVRKDHSVVMVRAVAHCTTRIVDTAIKL